MLQISASRRPKRVRASHTIATVAGVPIKNHREILKNEPPHVLVGTPGRILGLLNEKTLNLGKIKHFVLDECDRMLEALDMRRDVQNIFKATPHDKQVMMFSATLSKEIRPVCRKFCTDVSHLCTCRRPCRLLMPTRLSTYTECSVCGTRSALFCLLLPVPSPARSFLGQPMEIYVDDETKLTLHGLAQFYLKLDEAEKNRKLNDLLDALEFNQVVIFVSAVARANELNRLLTECNFPSICIHGSLSQKER